MENELTPHLKSLLDKELDDLYMFEHLITRVKSKLEMIPAYNNLDDSFYRMFNKYKIIRRLVSFTDLHYFIYGSDMGLMSVKDINYYKFLKDLEILLRRYLLK